MSSLPLRFMTRISSCVLIEISIESCFFCDMTIVFLTLRPKVAYNYFKLEIILIKSNIVLSFFLFLAYFSALQR